jgi:hypothetical protein
MVGPYPSARRAQKNIDIIARQANCEFQAAWIQWATKVRSNDAVFGCNSTNRDAHAIEQFSSHVRSGAGLAPSSFHTPMAA